MRTADRAQAAWEFLRDAALALVIGVGLFAATVHWMLPCEGGGLC